MANGKASLVLKVTTLLNTPPPIHQNNRAFNLLPNNRLYTQFSIAKHLIGYVPYLLEPTNVYHQMIKNELFKHDIIIKESKFPYSINVDNFETQITLNIKIRLYSPNILSLTIKLSGISSASDAAELAKRIKSTKCAPINNIIQFTIGMVQAWNHKKFISDVNLRYKPIYYVEESCSPDEFKNQIDGNVSCYVNYLIKNNHIEVTKSIQSEFLYKNKYDEGEHSEQLLLVDKQGLFYIKRNNEVDQKELKAEFLKIESLYEIAIISHIFLKEYPFRRRENEDLNDFYLYKIKQFIDSPDLIFESSIKHQNMWMLLVDEFKLNVMIQHITDGPAKYAIEKKAEAFRLIPYNWWEEADLKLFISNIIKEANKEGN